MTTALKYLSQMTDRIFTAQMERAAHKISAHELFLRRAASSD